MEARKLIEGGGTQQEFEAAMRALAQTIREATECMLELEHAMELLQLAGDPARALAVRVHTASCLQRAMRRPRR